MKTFTQIIPRLSRRPTDETKAATAETEFTVKPVYELKEADEAWGLTVQLPGVTKDGLDVTAEDGVLTIRGRRAWEKPESWTAVWRESADASFELRLEHDNSVDVDKIHADLKDGVLRVSLPKAEAVKPRKIAIN